MSRAQSQSDPGYTIRPPGSPPTGELRWFFRPFPSLPEKWRSPLAQDQLLSEYLSDHTNFAHFATTRGLTVDQLYDWLHSEQVIDRRKRMEHLAQERADLLARLARPAAIESLLRLIQNRLLQPNQHRLAACCLIRAAESADRRDERRAREEVKADKSPTPAVPRVSGSSAGPCDVPQIFDSNPKTAAQASRLRVSPAPMPVKTPGGPSTSRSRPSQILARIGHARSPIPPHRQSSTKCSAPPAQADSPRSRPPPPVRYD